MLQAQRRHMSPGIIAALWLCALAAGQPSMLQQQMQEVINNISAITGYAISVGFVNPTDNFGIGSGPRDPLIYQPVIGGVTGGNDTMLLGSGTKPLLQQL